MLQFNSALLAIAGSFAGAYAPYQAIHLQPHMGGVLVVSSDHGKVSAFGFDPAGRGDETIDLIPSKDLLKSCTGIKSAERDVRIEGDTATVTTYRKTAANEVKQFHALRSTAPFPPLDRAIAACMDRWGATPETSATAGRYAAPYLEKAIRAAGSLGDSLVLSAFDGGPLRLHSEEIELMILVMPQTAEPIPALPSWIQQFGRAAAA
jgi:hypothetical protein